MSFNEILEIGDNKKSIRNEKPKKQVTKNAKINIKNV